MDSLPQQSIDCIYSEMVFINTTVTDNHNIIMQLYLFSALYISALYLVIQPSTKNNTKCG